MLTPLRGSERGRNEGASDDPRSAATLRLPPPLRIRPIALGVLIVEDHLLVFRARDSVKGEVFHRLLGGAIEFGERAEETVRREFREEIGRDIEVGSLLAVSENLFTNEGGPGHEVVFEFDVRFAPGHEPADLNPFEGQEDDGSPLHVMWLPTSEVLDGTHIVYPDGLPERLAGWLDR